MARKKNYSAHSKPDKRQLVIGLCTKCGPGAEVVKALILGAKKRWEWRCKACGQSAERQK